MATTEIVDHSIEYASLIPKKFIIISLGTGCESNAGLEATQIATWSALRLAPLVVDNVLCGISKTMDQSLSSYFNVVQPEAHILRIQEYELNPTEASVDIATKMNLERLVEIGEGLLDKPASMVSLDRGFVRFRVTPQKPIDKR